MDPSQQGTLNRNQGGKTEAAILNALVQAGISVLMPWNTYSRYDFVVEIEKQFIRIQCKTASLSGNIISFRPHSKKDNKKIGYKGQADFFFVFEPKSNKVYYIKVDECPKNLCKFFLTTKSKKAKLAENYEFKGNI